MATKKIIIQVVLDDKASKSGKKIGDAVVKTTTEFKKMTAEQEKNYIAQQKSQFQSQLYTNSLKAQALAQVDVAAVTGKSRAQSGLNNAILLESGRLASDLNYGFTAIANNLGQLVSLFGSFADTNGGVIASFKKLIASLWGMGGILIGVQLLIAFGPDILKFLKDLTGFGSRLKDAFDDVSSSIGETTGRFELYIRTLEDSTKSEKEHLDAIKKLNKEFPEYIKELGKAGLTIDDVKNKTNDAAIINNKQRKTIMNLAMARAAQSKIEDEAAKLLELNIDEELSKRDILNEQRIEIDKNNTRLANRELLRRKVLSGAATEQEETRLLYADMGEALYVSRHQTELKGIQKRLDAITGSNEKEKTKINETIDLLLEFTDIQIDLDEKKADSRKEYTELSVANFDKEIKAIQELGGVRKKFFDRNLAQDAEDKQFQEDKIILLREQELARVNVMEGSDVAKNQARLEINTFYDKLLEDAEEKTQQKLSDIREKWNLKTLKEKVDVAKSELTTESEVLALINTETALLTKQKELDILALDDLKISTTEKEEAEKDIIEYYAQVSLKNEKKYAKAREKITDIEKKSKLQALDDMGKGLMAASQIAGKATGAGKALAIAGTTMSTYSAAQKAYESQLTATPDSPIRAAIAAAAAIAQGLANVKAIVSVKTPGMSSASVSGGGPTTVQAPDFNVVGQGVGSQLAGVVSNQFGGALRAYVVSGDISSAQELDRKINTTATIG